jgi:hypothetical protein
MIILLSIILVLVGLVVMFLIVGLVAKTGYVIERSVLINKPKQQVFDYIKLLRNQDYYSKWVMVDPGMKKVFTGTDGAVGFTYAWNSTAKKNAGAGEMEIKSIKEGERIESEIRFERPMKAVSHAVFATENTGAQTKATWIFQSEMKYPMNAMMLIIPFEKMLGRDMEESLALLKKNLEK